MDAQIIEILMGLGGPAGAAFAIYFYLQLSRVRKERDRARKEHKAYVNEQAQKWESYYRTQQELRDRLMSDA